MKKEVKGNFILILGFVLLLSIGFVAAAEGDVGESPLSDLGGMVESGFEQIQPVLKVLLGTDVNISSSTPISSDYLARIMFLLVVFSIVYMTVLKMPFFNENDAVRWILTIAVTVLATRWLATEGIVQALLLPYDTVGITLSAFLPLLIFFIFLDIGLGDTRYKTIRKSAWILLTVVFLFYWFIRYDDVIGGGNGGIIAWIYPVSALACFVFFWFDGTIGKWRAKVKIDTLRSVHSMNIASTIKDKMAEVNTAYQNEGDAYKSRTSPTSKKTGSDARKFDLDKLSKELAKLES